MLLSHPSALALTLSFTISLGSAMPQTCEQLVFGSGATTGTRFGEALALDGSTAAVGAIGFFQGGIVGGVYVLELDAMSQQWAETDRLLASVPEGSSDFGYSVALAGDVLAVGARREDAAGTDSGAVHIFRRDSGGTWSESQVLVGSSTVAGDEFGSSVALTGDSLIVGAPRAHRAGTSIDVGKVVTFLSDPQTGLYGEVMELQPSTLTSLARYGDTLETDGSRLVIAATASSVVGSLGGEIEVYSVDPTTAVLTFEQAIAPADLGSNDLFGRAIDLEGTRMVIGARSSDVGTWSGAAYVYDLVGGTWVMADKLVATDGETFDQAGTSVLLAGDRILVGAPADDDSGSNAGSIYEYSFDTSAGSWSETDKFRAATVDGNDAYGSSIALGTTSLLVGAPGRNAPGETGGMIVAALDAPGDCDMNGLADVCEIASGSAEDLNGNFVIDTCENLGSPLCSPAVPNSTGQPSTLWAFGSLTAANNDLLLVVTDLPTPSLGYFLVSPDTGFVTNPGGSTGNLCIAGPSIGRYAGSVQSSGSNGEVRFTPDLTNVPQPTGSQPTTAGQTWCFQYWHRDFQSGATTSNFSDARRLDF